MSFSFGVDRLYYCLKALDLFTATAKVKIMATGVERVFPLGEVVAALTAE